MIRITADLTDREADEFLRAEIEARSYNGAPEADGAIRREVDSAVGKFRDAIIKAIREEM